MRRIVALVVACGAPPQHAEPPPAPTPAADVTPPPPPPPEVVSPEAACARLEALSASGCGNFKRMSIGGDRCPEVMAGMMQDPAGLQIARCLARNDTCTDVQACIQAGNEVAVKPEHLQDCTHHQPNAMVGVEDYASRNTASSLPAARSSKARPLEACGFAAEQKLLQDLTCADDTHPLATGMDVEHARVGDVGAGGRCDSIVDLYRITCPDRTYDVYVDAYVCPK